MKKLVEYIISPLLLLILSYTCSQAQLDFQTIVTKGPVIVGESFQVQYVLEDMDKDNEFFAPDFKGFRFVSGPNIYTGSAYGSKGHRKLKNIVYTLAATTTGKFIIPGASARVENRLIKSENVLLQVISKVEAYNRKKSGIDQQVNEDIYLNAHEDPHAKIRRNLFMKVLVDKNSCFVGEPVTAIFKLYSRLDSKSDIVKNPGFYGFTVQDMINLDNRATSTETINGKDFDVHIVRKVQLYPLQAGVFNIDAMEVRNKVRFSKSAIIKKAEQEILEGIVADNDDAADVNTTIYENSMATETIAINVKPTPLKNKPVEYSGATGNFKIAAWLKKRELAKNEEGDLVITISGRGNFTQISAPVVQWPAGIEGFEPTVKDSLDHMQAPMNGKREFHFRFVSSRSGSYDMPGVNFSYFNPDTNNYKTILTQPASINITNFEKGIEKVKEKNGKTDKNKRNWWWVGIVAMGFVAGVGLFFIRSRNGAAKKTAQAPAIKNYNIKPTIAEILQPAIIFSGADDKTFYTILRSCTWNFFSNRFDLKGSQMNKFTLSAVLQQKKIHEKVSVAIVEILSQCETGTFTNIEDFGNKKQLLDDVKELLEKIDEQVD